ncbi:MAG: amidophosphoribosyltransferase [Bacteroidales bacterium]|nr:amidophosphoribosyltransferase [Bacteroidales bacterium]
MSDKITHECGIAFIRLLKPLEYYLGKYGTSFYGLQKLHLLMEKQHNRGQDGAGVANIKLNMPPGQRYMHRVRFNTDTPIKDCFNTIFQPFKDLESKNVARLRDFNWMKQNLPFTGEIFLGHLRYGTFGGNDVQYLHPVARESNWKTQNLILAGNFNMTNVDELFDSLIKNGQYPMETSDTITILEKLGHFLDDENERIYQEFKAKGYNNEEITKYIIENLDIIKILRQSAEHWDGGYVISGIFGHGDAFVMRDPAGIRPAFYYMDDEIVVAASERPVIQTAFNLKTEQVHELPPAQAMIVRQNGQVSFENFKEPLPKKPCSFERIYFSRGSDQDIYRERKKLGILLTPAILKEIDYDVDHTVFSYIPNTASVSFYGMMKELERIINLSKVDKIKSLGPNPSDEEILKILNHTPRMEKLAVKDIKLRTFITEDSARNDLVAHVYDVTYGVVRPGIDSLVVIDDSIVRGTTLRNSIIRILDRLEPKKIVVASSAPQIRYPDCYGIDMAKIGDFIAFQAALSLLKDNNMDSIINHVYKKCKEQEYSPKEEIINHVKEIYEPFTSEQISQKITQLLTPPDLHAELGIVFNSIDNLHVAIPDHQGDWYFSGNYPTPGGNKTVNKAFINFIENRNERAY